MNFGKLERRIVEAEEIEKIIEKKRDKIHQIKGRYSRLAVISEEDKKRIQVLSKKLSDLQKEEDNLIGCHMDGPLKAVDIPRFFIKYMKVVSE